MAENFKKNSVTPGAWKPAFSTVSKNIRKKLVFSRLNSTCPEGYFSLKFLFQKACRPFVGFERKNSGLWVKQFWKVFQNYNLRVLWDILRNAKLLQISFFSGFWLGIFQIWAQNFWHGFQNGILRVLKSILAL